MMKNVLLAPLLLGVIAAAGQTQSAKGYPSQEQSRFSAEQDIVPVEHPANLPEAVLGLLTTDNRVQQCVQHENLSANQLPPSRFVASEIHLDGKTEADLIVQPALLSDTPAANRCLFGARTVQFWVFRKTAQGYESVLSITSVGLTVLNSKWKGYRDVEVSESNVSTMSETLYRFDGKQYRRYQTKTKPIG
jgi:hypothetical protein